MRLLVRLAPLALLIACTRPPVAPPTVALVKGGVLAPSEIAGKVVAYNFFSPH
jgi:hypothetical protein